MINTIKERLKNWKVLQYRCNYSAFNGNRYTPSAYSCLTCEVCNMVWRTKASYANTVYLNQKSKT